MSKKVDKRKLYILIAFFLVIFIGFFFYFSQMKSPVSSELPPSLKYDTRYGQGIATLDGDKYFSFDESNSSIDAAHYFIPAGVNYFYSNWDLTVQEIINSIEPDSDNKFVIAYYGGEKGMKFHTYPQGLFQNTDELLLTDIIDAFTGFVIIAEKDFKVTRAITLSSFSLGKSYILPNFYELDSGWHLFYVKSKWYLDLLISDYSDLIKSIYIQDSAHSFTNSLQSLADYYLVWFLLDVSSEQQNLDILERQSFITVIVDSLCAFPKSFDPAISDILEIHSQYGLYAHDQNTMQILLEKYKDSSQVKNFINLGVGQCNQQSSGWEDKWMSFAYNRDKSRLNDLLKVQLMLVNYSLDNNSDYPGVYGTIEENLETGWGEGEPQTWGEINDSYNGVYQDTVFKTEVYPYKKFIYLPKNYLKDFSFCAYFKVDDFINANASCQYLDNASQENKVNDDSEPDFFDDSDWCYALFSY